MQHPTSLETTREPQLSTSGLVLFAILGALLVWLILTRTLAAALAESHPSLALVLQPYEPAALTALADEVLGERLEAAGPDAAAPDNDKNRILKSQDQDRLTAFSRLAEQAMQSGTTDDPPDEPVTQSTDAGPRAPAPERALPTLPPEEAERIRTLAGKSILASPLNAPAYSLLARVSEFTGEDERTTELMRFAARLSLRESYAIYWLMLEAARKENHAQVVRYADILLRSRSNTMPLVLPLLARIAEARDDAHHLNNLLATDPPWRSAFLARLTGQMTDARTPLHLLLALQPTGHPPTPGEIRAYIAFLIGKRFYELAYYTWLQFLPREDLRTVSHLYNPDFERLPSGAPFDWVIDQGSGAMTEFRPRPDSSGGQALVVEFRQGRAEFPGVKQLTLLAPGTYVLKGKFQGSLAGPRGLVWSVSCASRGALAQGDPLRGSFPEWRDFSLTFTVPETGCRAQQVRLELDARSASEKLVAGTMWFDDLEMQRGG